MRTATLEPLVLESGAVVSPATIAWSQYGPAPERARATFLVLHGITSSPQAAMAADDDPAFCDRGWFAAWVGAGLVFDITQDCILVPNALGSCFGSSGPRPDALPSLFPAVTIRDTVNFYHRWLNALHIPELAAVVGFSYGGYQAFQWAVQPPLPTCKTIVLASAPRGNGTAADVLQLRNLARQIDNGDKDAAKRWVDMRLGTLNRYGYADWLRDHGGVNTVARLRAEAEQWAVQFSPWSLACLRAAAIGFDVTGPLRSSGSRMPLLWMASASDILFPCNFKGFERHSQMQCQCIDGKYGHMSPIVESDLWTGHVRGFLDP